MISQGGLISLWRAVSCVLATEWRISLPGWTVSYAGWGNWEG